WPCPPWNVGRYHLSQSFGHFGLLGLCGTAQPNHGKLVLRGTGPGTLCLPLPKRGTPPHGACGKIKGVRYISAGDGHLETIGLWFSGYGLAWRGPEGYQGHQSLRKPGLWGHRTFPPNPLDLYESLLFPYFPRGLFLGLLQL